jgi:hypothetical protein
MGDRWWKIDEATFSEFCADSVQSEQVLLKSLNAHSYQDNQRAMVVFEYIFGVLSNCSENKYNYKQTINVMNIHKKIFTTFITGTSSSTCSNGDGGVNDAIEIFKNEIKLITGTSSATATTTTTTTNGVSTGSKEVTNANTVGKGEGETKFEFEDGNGNGEKVANNSINTNDIEINNNKNNNNFTVDQCKQISKYFAMSFIRNYDSYIYALKFLPKEQLKLQLLCIQTPMSLPSLSDSGTMSSSSTLA